MEKIGYVRAARKLESLTDEGVEVLARGYGLVGEGEGEGEGEKLGVEGGGERRRGL